MTSTINCAPNTDVDVVIIGAGLSGLTAAREIVNAGYSCRVLEARDRVGGRTWSRPLPSLVPSAMHSRDISQGMIDLGASWLNDTNQECMAKLTREFGLTLVKQNITGDAILEEVDGSLKIFPYGGAPDLRADIQEHLAYIRDRVEADCQSIDVEAVDSGQLTAQHLEWDSMTFEEYLQDRLGASEIAIESATIWTRAMLSREPSDISTLFYLRYLKAGGGLVRMRSDGEHGGQYLRVAEGGQSVALNLAKTLPKGVIRLETPVKQIEQTDEGTVIVNQSLRCRKVICTVPPPLTKTIQFRPPLPHTKRRLLDSYGYRYYQKVMVVFKSSFWAMNGYCGLVSSFKGPIAVIRDTSVHASGLYVLTCFLAGAMGQQWSQLTDTGRREAILCQLERLYGSDTRSEFVDMVGHEWNEEQWSGYGCPTSSLGPDILSQIGSAFTESVGDIHFAGTETSDVWQGLMEGAVRSGEKEARRVIIDLKAAGLDQATNVN